MEVTQAGPATSADWRAAVARYVGPSVARSLFQLVTTVGLAAFGFVAMYWAWTTVGYWLALVLAIPTAGVMVRMFIIMHDCTHGSFLPWRMANDGIGFITGALTLTPFAQWRRDHALHHASSGDLDRRGHGDITTYTVREYRAMTEAKRAKYRFSRHPLTMLLLGPLHLAINQRFRPQSKATKEMHQANVFMTNVAVVLLFLMAVLLFGIKNTLMLYLPVYYIAGAVGIWLFYVQHQFEDAYWDAHPDWDYATAALRGSSHLKLNPVLRWFTGNIGLHHIHHLAPRIPNYRLQKCHEENEMFQVAPIVTVASGISALRLALWDEDQQRLVRFADVD